MGFEPTTFTLQGCCSPVELPARFTNLKIGFLKIVTLIPLPPMGKTMGLKPKTNTQGQLQALGHNNLRL